MGTQSRPLKSRFAAGLKLAGVGCLGLMAATGCGKPGTSSSGTGMAGGGGASSSSSTVQAITKSIQADPQLAAAGITVAEDRGSIALQGTVASEDLKDRAEKIVYDSQKQAKQQPGVWDYLMVSEAPGTTAPGAGAQGR